MSAQRLYFEPVDPIRKQPVLVEWYFPGEGIELSIRPFWITMDLILINDWLREPGTRQNAGYQKFGNNLLPFYRELLLSDSAQVLTILKNKKEIAFFVIQPVINSGWKALRITKAYDCTIHYVIPDTHIAAGAFRLCLFLIANYFYSIGNTGDLYLTIPAADGNSNNASLHGGFEFAGHFAFGSTVQNLYLCTFELLEKKRSTL